jgi:hypothetical protein
MANPWLTHLKNVHKSLPKGTSLGKAMKMAKKTYKKLVKPNKKHSRSYKKRGGSSHTGENPVLIK